MIVTQKNYRIATVKYLFYNTEKLSRILFYNLHEKFFELFLPYRWSITFDTRLYLYFRQWKGNMRKIKQ